MKQLLKTSDPIFSNIGGINKIYAAPHEETWLAQKTVHFVTPDNVYEIYCTPESCTFKEEYKKESSGIHYDTEFKGFIPKDREEIKAFLDQMEGRKFFIILQDNNGMWKLAGHQFFPLSFSVTTSPGKSIADRNGVEISFKGITRSRAVFVDNPF